MTNKQCAKAWFTIAAVAIIAGLITFLACTSHFIQSITR